MRTARGDLLLAFGLIGVVVGGVAIALLGGLSSLQSAANSVSFARIAVEQGNQVRWASLVDIVLFVPGYVAAGTGLFYGFRTVGSRGMDGVSAPGRFGAAIIWCVALADQAENLVLQAGLGAVDLDDSPATAITVSERHVDVMRMFGAAKWTLAAVALVAFLTAWVWPRRTVPQDG